MYTYDRTAHADTDGELHLVLHGHPYRRDVLSGVRDDGQKDETDERAGDVIALCCLFDRGDHCV